MSRSNLRTLARSTAAYSINTLVGPLFTILLTPIYIRVLSRADFGTLALARTLVMIVTVLGMLGLATAMGALLHDQPDDEAQQRLLSTAIWLGAGCSALLALAGVVGAAPLAQWWLGDAALARIVALYMLYLPFFAFFTLCVAALRLRQEALRASILGLAQVLLLPAFTLTLVVGLRLGVAGALGAEVLAYACLSGLCLLVAPRYVLALPRALLRRWSPLPLVHTLLAVGVPLVPSGLAIWALGFADRPLLQQLGVGIAAIGVYDIASKLASMLALISIPFQYAWTPFALAIQQQPDARPTYARILRYYVCGMLGAVLALSLFAREILLVFTDARYLAAQNYVWLLAQVAPIQGSAAIVSIGLYVSRRTAHMAWTTMLGAAVNVALNLLLIPRFGVLGAAIATPLGYACWPVATYIVAQRAYPVPYEVWRLAVALGAQLALIWQGLLWSAETSAVSLAMRMLLLLAYPLLLVMLGVITRAEIARGWAWLRRRLSMFRSRR